LALSRGSFLPACESDWASDARAELKAIVGAAFVELADCASARKDWRRALEYSLEAVECDPTNELAAAIQIQAAFVGGSRAAAWRAFRQYVRAVRDEYGAEPSPDVRRLYERLIVPPSEDRAGKEKPRLR
jgi:DNA-binding SARP family transcriptional activator